MGESNGADEPRSHRRPGPAQIRLQPAGFWREVYENPREPAAVLLGVVISLGWGLTTLVDPASVAQGLAALSAVVGGILLATSYYLKFRPNALDEPFWERSRASRVSRWVLRNTWWVFILAALIYWLTDVLRSY